MNVGGRDMTAAAHRARLVGRGKELARLGAAVRSRSPLLIYGPPGAGKTFLVESFLGGLPAAERSRCVYVPGFVSVHAMLEETVRQLAGAPMRRSGHATSGRLRVWLRAAARERGLCLFLDHFPIVSPFLARLVEELMWKGESCVYLLARGRTRDEVGSAASIYFTPEYRLALGALHAREANALLDECVERF